MARYGATLGVSEGDDDDDYHPRHRAPTLDDSNSQSQSSHPQPTPAINRTTTRRTTSSTTMPATSERTPLLARQYSSASVVTQKQPRSRLTRYCCCCCPNWKYALALWAGLILLTGAVILLVLSANSSRILLSFLSSLGSLSTCSTCFSLLVPLRQLAVFGDGAFTKTFTTLCVDLNIQPREICEGAVARQGPVIAQSLRAIQPNRRTAASLCTKLFGLCSSRGSPVQDWPGELFPKPDPHRKHPSKRTGPAKVRKVVQISDLHIDKLYKAGAEATCVGVLCCRENSGFLLDRSKPLRKAGPYGDIRCDTPPSLFKSMLDAIQEHAGDAEFVISTGDIPSHAVWEETPELTSKDIYEAYAIMRAALKVPVYGAIGNHDIAPVNLFPPSSNYEAFAASQWVYDTHYNAWRDWIGTAVNQKAFAKAVGSYAIDVQSMNVRLISINTNYWSQDDFYLYATEFQPDDPEGVLGFLMQELQQAETHGQHAIIIGHASPATAMPAQSHYFDQIIQRYRATVVGQFYGHTHSSDFVVSYSTPASKTAETASSVGFVAGALTPLGGMVNPGFRVYELDAGTGEIWDWKEYYTNISDPTFNDGPVWRELYSAREAYSPLIAHQEQPQEQEQEQGLQELSEQEPEPLGPAFWHKVTEALESSETAFRKFIFNKFRGSRFGERRACRTDKCRGYAICGLRRGRSEERCLTLHLGKDEPPPVATPEPRRGDEAEHEHEHGREPTDGKPEDKEPDAAGKKISMTADEIDALDPNEMMREGGGHTNIHGFGLKELLEGMQQHASAGSVEIKELKKRHARKALGSHRS